MPDPRPFSFDHIPTLKELLPKTAGVPGVEYLQCVASNLPKAENQGWLGVQGARSYEVTGAEGKRAAMVLLAMGKPLDGLSPFTGSRKCWVDIEVETLTGHTISDDAKAEPSAVPASTKAA